MSFLDFFFIFFVISLFFFLFKFDRMIYLLISLEFMVISLFFYLFFLDFIIFFFLCFSVVSSVCGMVFLVCVINFFGVDMVIF